MIGDHHPKQRFWTGRIVLLIVINIVFLSIIAIGLVIVASAFSGVIASWLGRVFGL